MRRFQNFTKRCQKMLKKILNLEAKKIANKLRVHNWVKCMPKTTSFHYIERL